MQDLGSAKPDRYASRMFPSIHLPPPPALGEDERRARARAFAESMASRRSVRDFAPTPVPREVIEDCLRAAGAAPSGANQQPWRFIAVQDQQLKREIRAAAEHEEREFYDQRAPEEWLMALAPFGTHAQKPFLEQAPWVIAIFYERFGFDRRGERIRRYLPVESTAIATGILLAALHQAGLSTLLYAPSSMEFLYDLLGRSRNETPFAMLVVGHAAPGCRVPDIRRMPLAEYAHFI